MPRPNKTMTARTILTLLLTIALAAGMMATISGDEGTEERTLPTISISATGGTTAVTEGEDVSFTITADPAPAVDTEVWIFIITSGKFTDLPEPGTDEYLLNPDKIKIATIIAGSTQMEKTIATIDDGVDEENGYVIGSLIPRPAYTLGTTSQLIQVQDNDPTSPPEMMAPPTVLHTNGGLEIFWEEPAHTGDRKITGYSISWFSASDGGSASTDGDYRHHTVSGLTNGTEYTVRVQACKAHTYCSPDSDGVTATPTDSGLTITGPGAATLPEEAEGTVGQYSASSGTPTAWRLGGDDAEFFSQTVDSGGDMTLTLNEGINFEERQDRSFDNTFEVTVVATGSSSDRASNTTQVTVTVTDVDETPVFDPDSLDKGTYVVGEAIEPFLLPAPKADEVPITYEIKMEMGTEKLPPGLTRFGTRGISGTPTLTGEYTTIYTAKDKDGDEGSVSIEFTVVETANNAPTVAAEIDNLYMNPGGSTVTIDLSDKFLDPDGDTLIYTATSDNTSVATTMINGSTLTLTPAAEGAATISVTAFDRGLSEPGRLSVSQEFTLTVNSETIAITPTGTSFGKGTSKTLSVTGTNLDPTQTYSLEATLDGEEAAFNRDCTDRTATGELATVLTGPRVKSFVIHGCNLGDAEITVKLSLGTDELNSATATATVTGTPDKPEISTKATSDGTITLEIELGHSVDSFEVQQYQGITPTILPFGNHTLSRTLTSTGSTGPTKAEATVGGLLNGVEYRYRVVSRNATGISTSEDHIVALQAVPPINLDLEPRPYRQVALLWDTSANASNTTYSLMIRATDRSVARATVADAEAPFLINLDDIVDGANNPNIDRHGLGSAPYAYQVTLRANGIPGTDLNDSPESEPLIIIDTPITRVDGATPEDSGAGQMEIHWAPVDSIVCSTLTEGTGTRSEIIAPEPCTPLYPGGEYELRYRKLASGDNLPNWDRYQYDGVGTKVDVPNQGPVTIEGLELERIYAVQLLYIAPLREGRPRQRPGYTQPGRPTAGRLQGSRHRTGWQHSPCTDTGRTGKST